MGRNRPSDDLFILKPGGALPPWPLAVTEIGASWWPAGRFMRREQSRIMALELVLEGQLALTQDDRESRIGPGEVFVLRRNSRQFYHADGGPVRKRFIGLGGPVAEQLLATLPDRVVVADRALVKRLLERVERCFRQRGPDWQAEAAGDAYRLLAGLSQANAQGQGPVRHPAVTTVLRILQEDGGCAVCMPELARRAGISPAHLTRLFREEFQCSPARFVRDRLLEQARFLLSSSPLNCQAIALKLGFSDAQAFSKMFHRAEGVAPMAYRARLDRA